MAVIANRYGQALYDLAKSKEDKNEIEKALEEFTKLFNSNEELRRTLLDPRIEDNLKIDILKEIISDSKNKIFINFLELLIKEKRINILDEILYEYKGLNGASKKELSIKIVVAQKISDEQVGKIVEKYKKQYDADSVKYEIEIDEEIIGGVKVIIGNTVYDGSIKTQLKKMF